MSEQSSSCSSLTRSSKYGDALPVTVLTGFLGSGKTTLLNHVLRSKPDMRIAVIENEFGEVGIDNELVITTKKNLFELSDGCICCTVREELMEILNSLTTGPKKYDHIVIETSGLADPAPVAQTLFIDDKVKQRASLNTVVTVVDAKHMLQHIEESRACLDQIAFADTILVNKCDLVTSEEIDLVEARIRKTNGSARIQRISHGKVAAEDILEHSGFDLGRALEEKPAFLRKEYPFEHAATYELTPGKYEVELEVDTEDSLGVILIPHTKKLRELEGEALSIVLKSEVPTLSSGEELQVEIPAMLDPRGEQKVKRYPFEISRKGPYALFTQYDPRDFGLRLVDANGESQTPIGAVDYTVGHEHDYSITSVSLAYRKKVDEKRLAEWLTGLFQEKNNSIYRTKGIVDVAGKDTRTVIHGVHSLLNFTEDRPWNKDEARASQLVFIGRDLDKKSLKKDFRKCLV